MMNTAWNLLRVFTALAGIALVAFTARSETPALYQNGFENTESGKVPEEMLVLDGQFAVKELDGNKVLELPGAPLESFGVLFGPTEKSKVVVSATILATGKGRRYPTFGIGALGAGGFRLQVSPGKKQLELYKNEEVLTSVPFEWKAGEWTEFRLSVGEAIEGKLKLEGRVWAKGGEEPKAPSITHEAVAPASGGRASIWGSPFSGTPIQFDNLLVRPGNEP